MPNNIRPIYVLLEELGITPEDIYNRNPELYKSLGCDNFEEALSLMIRKGTARAIKTPHSFITISLPAEDYMKDFSADIKACLNRNSAMLNGNSYMFNLEFYGKSSAEHPHAHILIKGGGMDKSKIIRAFARQFKIKDNFIDVQRSECGQLYTKREAYIKGNKQEKKMEQVEKDRDFRKNNNIEEYYVSI